MAMGTSARPCLATSPTLASTAGLANPAFGLGSVQPGFGTQGVDTRVNGSVGPTPFPSMSPTAFAPSNCATPSPASWLPPVEGQPSPSSSPTAFASSSASPFSFQCNNAAAAASCLDGQLPRASAPTRVQSAFEVLGIPSPGSSNKPMDQGERFIQAITGEKRSIPTWSGQPATFRSWLKLLAVWESETTLARDRWGLRLFQSFPESSQPRKIADQIPMQDLLSERGYGYILTQLMAKYKPFLDLPGHCSASGDRPLSVHR